MAVMLTVLLFGATSQSPGARHSVEFWRQIARDHYAVPSGGDVAALSNELVDMLASADTGERDEIGYGTLASWIYQTRALTPEMLRPLVERLLANMNDGIDAPGDDRIFKRSFSALTLSVIVARDNAAPFLTAAEFHAIESAALSYLAREQDVRGFDETRGWMHSAAHTADLLKFVGRSRYLDPPGRVRILDAISAKLAGAPVVFTHGEDERLARAVLSIVNRADFDTAEFQAWTTRAKPPSFPEHPTEAQLRRIQNAKNMLAKLVVLLDVPDASDAVRSARASVLAALQTAF